MAREKGMGSLQQEKSGRWMMRVCIQGKRYSRSTRTKDKEKAERFLQRFLAPFGLGEHRLPLADVWLEYVKSPNRNELSVAMLNAKRLIWLHFARWMEQNHLEVTDLAGVTEDTIGEYLACLRLDVCASTYNGRVCVLREIFRVLRNKAGLDEDPWAEVRLRVDDSHSRRELSLDELHRLLKAAKRIRTGAGHMPDNAGSDTDTLNECYVLFLLGIYTGLRLGDCCTLSWEVVNVGMGIIQIIPQKTRRHARGRPITIPIHPALGSVLVETIKRRGSATLFGAVLPSISGLYRQSRWQVNHVLARIFKVAKIETSVQIEGRRRRTPEATFHSLRHTFVSLAANAGVPLHVVQSIVGHESTAMTRHYYHANLEALKQVVNAIPEVG